MSKEQWIQIIEHQYRLRLAEKGLKDTTLKEEYQMKYEIALGLLEELG